MRVVLSCNEGPDGQPELLHTVKYLEGKFHSRDPFVLASSDRVCMCTIESRTIFRGIHVASPTSICARLTPTTRREYNKIHHINGNKAGFLGTTYHWVCTVYGQYK